MRRKVGDRVEVKSRYFNPYNDHTGTIVEIDDHYHEFTVDFDEEWGVDGLKVFNKEELKRVKS